MFRVVCSFTLWLSLLLAPIFAVWADDSAYRECGQECAYRRAQDLNSLQTLYTIEKIDLLESALASARTQDQRDQLARENLGGFCYVGESGDDCFRRYKRVTKEELYALRQAHVKLGDQIKSLDSNVRVVDPSGVAYDQKIGGTIVVDNPELRKPERPIDPPTAADLARVYDSDASLRQVDVNNAKFERWVNANTQPVPNIDDFVEYSMVPIDPDNPAVGKVSRIRRDPYCPDKTPTGICFRRKDYEAAVKKYEAFKDRMADYRKEMKAAENYAVRPGTKSIVEHKNLEAASGKLGIVAYIRARNMLIDAVNRQDGGAAAAKPTPEEQAVETARMKHILKTTVDDLGARTAADVTGAGSADRHPTSDQAVAAGTDGKPASLSRVQLIYRKYFPDEKIPEHQNREIVKPSGQNKSQRLIFSQEYFDQRVEGDKQAPGVDLESYNP
ncbi:MAG: hypothetical protein AB7P04_00370 [Bacteriovoracia bacterium]